MSDPQSVNIGLALPSRGSDVGVWDTPVNNDFTALDGFFGGVQTITAGSSPITLTSPAAYTPTPSGGPTQAQNAVIRITGTLTAGVQITLPLPGYMIVENLTTGAFVLSFRAIGSGEIIAVDQGAQQHIYNDGTNVRYVNLPAVGSYLDVCDATVPAWITACTKPPYLNCDGTTFSAVTYPYLNSKLGGNTLPDFRGVSPAYLNQGTGRLTTAGSGLDGNTRFAIKTSQTYTLVLGNLPPITPTGTVTLNSLQLGSNISSAGGGGTSNITTGGFSAAITMAFSIVSSSLTFTGSVGGGSSTPFGVVGPTTIGGIRLIRAG